MILKQQRRKQLRKLLATIAGEILDLQNQIAMLQPRLDRIGDSHQVIADRRRRRDQLRVTLEEKSQARRMLQDELGTLC